MKQAWPEADVDGADADALLMRCAQGDRQALRALYDQQAARLRGIALRVVRDPALADDVLHDVFVRLLDSAESFDRERGSGPAYLTMVTRFRAMETIRRRGREPLLGPAAELIEGVPDELPRLVRDHAPHTLLDCLRDLPPNIRRLILLVFVEGRTHTELVALEGMKLGTVKSTIRRGLLTLRRCLDR